jgi:hypothetical protein
MEIDKKFEVYQLNPVMGSKKHLALEKVEFSSISWVNNFDTEDEAIQALINTGCFYEEFVILKTIYIRS